MPCWAPVMCVLGDAPHLSFMHAPLRAAYPLQLFCLQQCSNDAAGQRQTVEACAGVVCGTLSARGVHCCVVIVVLCRRCRLHVGPRYKARGLNDNADPGNEIECDQVVWKHSSSPEKPLAWSRWVGGSWRQCFCLVVGWDFVGAPVLVCSCLQ